MQLRTRLVREIEGGGRGGLALALLAPPWPRRPRGDRAGQRRSSLQPGDEGGRPGVVVNALAPPPQANISPLPGRNPTPTSRGSIRVPALSPCEEEKDGTLSSPGSAWAEPSQSKRGDDGSAELVVPPPVLPPSHLPPTVSVAGRGPRHSRSATKLRTGGSQRGERSTRWAAECSNPPGKT